MRDEKYRLADLLLNSQELYSGWETKPKIARKRFVVDMG
jgi:hypothetical protein